MTKQPANIIGFTVWILGSCFFFAEYFIRVSTGVLSTHLLSEFDVGTTAVGLLSAYFYYAYVSMQIPVGLLMDRFGVRWLLGCATIIFGAACLLLASMKHIEIGYLARFIMGFVGAFAFVGTLKLITVYFPANRFALLSGITQGSGMVGAIVGAAPMAYLFDVVGWRLAFLVFAVLFILLGVVMLVLIREQRDVEEAKCVSGIWIDIKTVLFNRYTWLNCLFIGLLYAPTEVFGEQWGVMFCNITNHEAIEKAAIQISCIFMGLTIGCPLLGVISDKIGSRIKVMRVSSVGCFCMIVLIVYAHILGIKPDFITLCVAMFIYGIFNSAIIPSYAIATELHAREVSGMAIGVTNMASVTIGAIFIPLIGKILDVMACYHVNQLGFEVHAKYNAHDFHTAFILLPVCFLICFLLTFFIKDTHCSFVTT